MFPIPFAFDVVVRYTPSGGTVLDPFAGRGSSIYAAASTGRTGTGIEINPVGWVYGSVKLAPATESRVLCRLEEIGQVTSTSEARGIAELPEFFHYCYAPEVLNFLVHARALLNWKQSRVDATLMAIILVYLHGKAGSSLSNQLRQGKAMSPAYCVRWWRDRELSPPKVEPVSFLSQRILWRYSKGRPASQGSRILLGDSMRVLPRLRVSRPFDLLFTSPPYYSVTNYHYDQWIRGWMMGGPNQPTRNGGVWQSRFDSKTGYKNLLSSVFRRCARLLANDANVYVRTDARAFTLALTIDILQNLFPQKELSIVQQPLAKPSQTQLYGDDLPKPGEVDVILTPR